MARPDHGLAGDWAQRLARGDRRCIARALTAVENDSERAGEILARIHPLLGRARVIGFTGPPGAGKSTLVGECIRCLRRRNLSVGVIAVDPSSPYSGGAVLGDRIRMQAHTEDPEVFIRSLATRGHLGGLSLCAARIIDVLDAAGKDVVLVETVGTGQSEIEVSEVADHKVVVISPGLGDEIQTLKAGVLEIADTLVVNKADLAYAGRCEADLRQMLGLRPSGAPQVAIFQTNAKTGEGVEKLVASLLDGPPAQGRDPTTRIRRALVNETLRILRQRLLNEAGEALDRSCRMMQKGELSLESAAHLLIEEIDLSREQTGNPDRGPRES